MFASIGWLWLAKVTSERGSGAYIHSIFVSPEHGGQVFGTRALKGAEEWATKLEFDTLTLMFLGQMLAPQRLYKK
ncbi:GNAT family N-acetyltransferase [Caballeronia sordidicola]|uniref:GNAT family N-acetyltransferase n=1 Tax=Caballeronia sordidicola TaxID=196367 RepID=UPI00094D976B